MAVIIHTVFTYLKKDTLIIDPFIFALTLVPNSWFRPHWIEFKYELFTNIELTEKQSKDLERIFKDSQNLEFSPGEYLPRDYSFYSTMGFRAEFFLKTE